MYLLFLCCLSPLSAMELGLDDNTKYTSDVNEGHVALNDLSKEKFSFILFCFSNW